MDTILKKLKHEMVLTITDNIMPFWLNMQDHQNGGFYGQRKGDGTLVTNANKGGILNARILWSFSAAYRITHNQQYLDAATRAKDYIITHFIDPVYGGIFWELDCRGNIVDPKKQFYAIGFAIYGLTEYARATNDDEALNIAIELYDVIEKHSLDNVNNGYIEACTRQWGEIQDMRLSECDANYPKSQNTHLHIIEPYANLYTVLKEKRTDEDITLRVEKSLRNLIDIFCNKIMNPDTHHLDLFFNMNWTRGGGTLESYGHDIECSWLLHEAALAIGDAQLLDRVEPIVKLLAKASEKGLNPDGSMVHEANLDTGFVDTQRQWWVQAEAVVGFYNIYQHFNDSNALQKALNCWQYIKDNLIDYNDGEWFWSCDQQNNINRTADKAGFWKCPYHNLRMCVELIMRIQ